MDFLFLLWLLFHPRKLYSRDEWLRTHGLARVADDEARRRRTLTLMALIGVGLFLFLGVGMEVARRHAAPAPVSTPVLHTDREAQDRSCAAWTLAVLRYKNDRAGESHQMAAAYSQALQAQSHACTAP